MEAMGIAGAALANKVMEEDGMASMERDGATGSSQGNVTTVASRVIGKGDVGNGHLGASTSPVC